MISQIALVPRIPIHAAGACSNTLLHHTLERQAEERTEEVRDWHSLSGRTWRDLEDVYCLLYVAAPLRPVSAVRRGCTAVGWV